MSAKKTAKTAAPAPAKIDRKPRAKTAPDNETREDRFKRIAKMRVTNALKFVSLIGNLSGPNYSYTQEQIDKIKTTLTDELNSTLKKFQPKDKDGKKARPTFEL